MIAINLDVSRARSAPSFRVPPGRRSLGLSTVPTLFPHSEAMIAKMGQCVLDEGAVLGTFLLNRLASNLGGAMRKDMGPSLESMAS